MLVCTPLLLLHPLLLCAVLPGKYLIWSKGFSCLSFSFVSLLFFVAFSSRHFYDWFNQADFDKSQEVALSTTCLVPLVYFPLLTPPLPGLAFLSTQREATRRKIKLIRNLIRRCANSNCASVNLQKKKKNRNRKMEKKSRLVRLLLKVAKLMQIIKWILIL